MFPSMRPVVLLIRKCALLLLAFSIFGFGLHARLAQYKPFPPNPTAAKVSTEKRSEQVLQALAARDEDLQTAGRPAFTFSLEGIRIRPVFQLATEQAKIGLSHPMRLDLNGVYSLHLPPPSSL